VNIDFWKQRWLDGQTGFHLDSVNTYLIHYWDLLCANNETVVFVPLCGKSLDMIWLAHQGCHVIGVECSDKAIAEFSSDNNLMLQQKITNGFDVHENKNICLIHCDYFELTADMMRSVSVVYDRASLVALPPEMREKYVKKQCEVLPENIKILLITLEYDQDRMSGPPFSVSQDEITKLYGCMFNIRELSTNNILASESRFQQRGLDYLIESVYLLER